LLRFHADVVDGGIYPFLDRQIQLALSLFEGAFLTQHVCMSILRLRELPVVNFQFATKLHSFGVLRQQRGCGVLAGLFCFGYDNLATFHGKSLCDLIINPLARLGEAFAFPAHVVQFTRDFRILVRELLLEIAPGLLDERGRQRLRQSDLVIAI
jgi:hypothetical protein